MEELRTEFDNFIKEWQQKGYSYDTLYAWMKQRILDYDSSRVELPVICPLTKYLERQKEWSIRTFGNGKRTLGIIRHIEKELKEVEAKPNDLTEWIDVIILALDGYWRHGGNIEIIMNILQAKQDNNFTRVYPFPKSEDEPSEHIRGI